MTIQTANAIRSVLEERLKEEGFALRGKWPRWSLQRSVGQSTDKIELLSESVTGDDPALRRMNVNFAVQHPRTGRDIWMNRPYEEWFEYGNEEQLERQLESNLSRIIEQALPWMEQMRSKSS